MREPGSDSWDLDETVACSAKNIHHRLELEAIQEYRKCVTITEKVPDATVRFVAEVYMKIRHNDRAVTAARNADASIERQMGSVRSIADAYMALSSAVMNDDRAAIESLLLQASMDNIATTATARLGYKEERQQVHKTVKPRMMGELDFAGVSVHFLQTVFLREVEEAGFSREAKIYDLEDLKGPPGLVRRKGQDIMCPMTKKKGAAYVHCLSGADNVGDATHMISYTWG